MRFQRVLAVMALGATCAFANSAYALTNVSWASLTSAAGGIVGGTITTPSGTVNLTYTGNYAFVQLNNTGVDYWTITGVGSPNYTQGVVNRPTGTDIIALAAGGTNTITFSAPVTNLYMAFNSWNGNNPTFSAPFTIISQGCGYWGCGTFVPGAGNTSFYGNGETVGVLEFPGTLSSLTFTDTPENWHGFTVGLASAPGPTPGAGLLGLGLLILAGAMTKARGFLAP